MTKFNVIQKRRREKIDQHKRDVYGDPSTRKLKHKDAPVSISGKRKRKLFKKWRRDQKEVLQKGLATMEDVEMAVTEGSFRDVVKVPVKFPIKKSFKLKMKRSLKGKAKKSKHKSSKSASNASESIDAMVE